MNKTLTATAIAGISFLAAAAPTLAAPATTSADWNHDCTTVTVDSNKDISNIVYRLNGVDTKIEFEDDTNHYQLPGDATDIWIKSGDNHSNDGSGYGEHFAQPDTCTTPPDTAPETNTTPQPEPTDPYGTF